MEDKSSLPPSLDLNQAYEELQHITRMLIKRDVMLIDAKLELETKVRDLERAREELVRISEYLANLLANSPDAIWILDNTQCVTSFNKMAEEITGYTFGEVICQPLDFLFPDPAVYLQCLRELPEKGSFRNLRTSIWRKNGERVELLMSISLLREKGEKGESIGSMTIVKDVTREIQLEAALREANIQLENKIHQHTRDLEILNQTMVALNQVATMASQSVDLDSLLNNILKLVLDITGFHMGAISTLIDQETISVRAHLNLPEPLLRSITQLKVGEGIIGRAASSGFLQVSGPTLSEMRGAGIRLAVAVPLRAMGTVQGVMSLLSNQAREISAEDQEMILAIGVQAGWALENARLYDHIRKDVDKLKEVDRIKTEFIATISHELRTPLTSIIGFLSYAEMALQKFDHRKLARYIHVALENGQKLAHMIEDLLAMQKLDSGSLRLHIDALIIRDLLEEIGKDLSPQLQAKEQRLLLALPEDLPLLCADAEQLERVITNLINNAIKFSEGPGNITISARYGVDEKKFYLTVADTGIGMSPEVCARVFDRFYQADNTLTRKAGGAGLGLTIAKRIVEMHGGTIYVESEIFQGSRFTVVLPDLSNLRLFESEEGDTGVG